MAEVVHRAPLFSNEVMPCCGLPPGERMADRMTNDPALVTCGRPPAVELRLLPPGQLLVATIPGNWDEPSIDAAADALDRARAALGLPDEAGVVLTGGITLESLTDEQLAGLRLLRAFGERSEQALDRAAAVLHRNRHRVAGSADEPLPDEDSELSAIWRNVAREVLDAYMGTER